MLLARAAPQAGEHVVHIGAGAGYYTAIMAHLVGVSGRGDGNRARSRARGARSRQPVALSQCPSCPRQWGGRAVRCRGCHLCERRRDTTG
jgi:hypothetical protein